MPAQPVVAVQKPISTASTLSPEQAVSPAVPEQVNPVTAATTEPKKKAGYAQRRHYSVRQSSAPKKTVSKNEPKQVVRDRGAIDAMLFAARSAESRRDYVLALKHYQAALDADPQNYRIMNNVASTMLNLGLNKQALVAANQALALKPDYPSALVNAGIALGRTGSESAARSMFNKALSLDLTNRSAMYSLAVLQERAGLLDDAMQLYRRMADAGDARGYLGQGRLLERNGDREAALRLYREVLTPAGVGQSTREQARERIRVLEQ